MNRFFSYLCLAAVASMALGATACTSSESSGPSPASAATLSRDDVIAAAYTELPRAATAIKLFSTTDNRQGCLIAYEDKAVARATLAPAEARSPFALTAWYDRGVSNWKADIKAPVGSVKELRETLRECVARGFVVDRYHAPRFEHDNGWS